MATTSINRTITTTGNRKTWTISMWLKRAENDTSQDIFGHYADASNFSNLRLDSANRIAFKEKVAGTNKCDLTGAKLFRDPAAWYHIVMAVDTTQSTASDRTKIYVNGTRITSWLDESYFAEDYESWINYEAANNYVGGYSGFYFGGEMSHVQLVDGLALAPTEFGSFDSTSGIWKIKTSCYGTPGTNGFCLKMEDRTNLDLDSSSNAHTFTTTGTLTATYDNPSNNFATLNPLNMPTASKPVISTGNNTVVTQNASGKYFGGTSSLGMVGGKWYCEFKAYSLATDGMVGINGASSEQARQNGQVSYSTSGFGYVASDGKKSTNLTDTAYGNSWTTANVIGVAVDLDNLKIYFAKDNVWQDSGDPTSGATGTGAAFTILAASATPEGFYAFSCADKSTGSSTLIVNFGNGYFGTTAVTSAEADGAGIGAFEFAPPTGYYALCTKNIKAYGG